MSSTRAQLQEALQLYITDIFSDLKTLQSFMKKSEASEVLQNAEEEMDVLQNADPRSTSEAWINYLCCSGPWSKPKNGKSWLCCCSSCVCCCSSCVCCCSSCACCSCSCTTLEEIEKALRERLNKALTNVQQQLDELKAPLLAIERLAVTSEWVFEQDPQAQVDLRGVDLRAVRRVLSLVKAVSPWVVVFKQDQIFKSTLENSSPSEENNDPQLNQADIPLRSRSAATAQDNTNAQRDTLGNKLETIEPRQMRLQAFISALKNICRPLQERSLMELHLVQPQVRLSEELSEERADEMLSLVQELQGIRENADFRLVFLLKDQAQTFTEELFKREAQMKKCLKEVRERAEKLEPTCCLGKADEERVHIQGGAGEGRGCFCSLMITAWWFFSRIIRAGGGVVSSLAGMAASVASLVGLLKRSVTLEVSTRWLLSGLILSSLSLFINLLTMIFDKSVNKCQRLKGDDICEELKGYRKVLQRCLDSATFSPTEKIPEEDQTLAGGKIGFYSLRFGLKIVDIIGDFFTFEEVKSITKGTFLWSVITNPIILVWDLGSLIYLFCVWCKGTGKPPVGARWLKARAALWEADMEDWKKIFKSLEKGQPRAERNKQRLNIAFY